MRDVERDETKEDVESAVMLLEDSVMLSSERLLRNAGRQLCGRCCDLVLVNSQ